MSDVVKLALDFSIEPVWSNIGYCNLHKEMFIAHCSMDIGQNFWDQK